MPSLARRLTPRPTYRNGMLRSLTAAASVKAGPGVDAEKPTGEGGYSRSWQKEAWDYYDLVGELHYAGSFVGSCLSRIRLTIAVPDAEGIPGPAYDEPDVEGDPPVPLHGDVPEAIEHLRELRAQIGGQSALLRAFGINLFTAGEGYLVGSEADMGPDLPAGARSWEVLSVDELQPNKDPKRDGSRYKRKEEPSAPPKDLPAETFVVRVWRGHPRFALLADAPTKAVREILEELVLLTREVRAQTLSRLASMGILIIPNEIDYPDDDGAADESDEGDPFTRDFIKTVSTAIADKGSAAGQVPFVLRAAYDYCDRIRHVVIKRDTDDRSVEKRDEAVLRLARGLDLPVEIVTGHAQTTFSNAWQIDESTYKAHIEPLVETVVDCLTTGYLRVLMPNTPLVISYDPSELVAHPDRAKDAKDGHAAFAISDAALRRATGFSEADAPDDDELARRIEIARNIKTPGANAPGTGPAPGLPTEGTPGGPGPGIEGNPGLTAAVEVSVLRAVQRAGARIRSKANGNESIRALIRSTPDAEVAATLGPAQVGQIVGDEDLFRSEFTALRRYAAPLVGAAAAEDVAAKADAMARVRLYGGG